LSCSSSTVNLKRRDEQVQFASQSCPGERIQPLANRHRLVYKIKISNLDLEPAPGGILADYTQFAGSRSAPTSSLTRHQMIQPAQTSH
jgi:hypothetical protein